MAVEEVRRDDRRRHIRWVTPERMAGRFAAFHEAVLIDISLGGALLEHASMVRPGTTSPLVLKIHGRDVMLKCRVVRSVVHRPEVRAKGGRELICRSGVEFLDASKDALQRIHECIQSWAEKG